MKPEIISGTSAGALAGAFYADGYGPAEILDLFSKRKMYDLVRLTFPRTGFVKVDGIKKLIKNHLKAKNLEDLNIPLIAAATNFNEAHVDYFSSGPVMDVLLASSCIPTLFEVPKINGTPYIDGGIMDNLPIEPLMKKCKKLIAVHVNPLGTVNGISNPIHAAERAFHLAVAAEINNKKSKVSVFIEPPDLTDYGLFDLRKAKAIYDIGYQYATSLKL
jgi:NTE family protein